MPGEQLRAEVLGVKDTVRALERVGKRAQAPTAFASANARAADKLLGDVVARTTRVRSGELRSSWTVTTEGAIANPVAHAGPQDMGWPARGIEPMHASIGALEAGADVVLGESEHELERIIAAEGFDHD